jgi:hypothetical protein
MLNVVAVHFGDYCGRGAEYVDRLHTDVTIHLPTVHKFWCITDAADNLPEGVEAIPVDQGVKGWWNKIALFRPGILPAGERVLYFDLDTMIMGDLSDLAAYRGRFGMARDFYFPHHCSSTIMAWEAGTLDHIWRVWDRCGRPEFQIGGDQEWIESIEPKADRLQDLLPDQLVSYKVSCRDKGFAPKGTRVVAFHGKPRPHEIDFNLPIGD